VTTTDVLAAKTVCWSAETADCLAFLRSLPDDSVDLTFGSPPYQAQRTYSIGFNLKGQDWVDWMVAVYTEAVRVTRGLVAFVVEGFTRKFQYSPTPYLLVADLHRKGFNLRKPPVFHRVGIAGSGGPDWLRNDYETIVCVTKPGKLVWSDNTACGHPPKWAPGGAMSHRNTDGRRVNQWGHSVESGATKTSPDGVTRSKGRRPSHVEVKTGSPRREDGSREGQTYVPPVFANPGNVLKFNVGGGCMGHKLAHENEAPFPLGLAEFFVRSFCPPLGVVCDPFLGSGSTCHAAVGSHRRFVGCDVRESQVELTTRRMSDVTPCFPECA
jgi:hypothetical protein